MYVVLVYDVNVKRVAKALVVCRAYLNWVQNSVFEGELSKAKLQALRLRLKKVIKESEDSVLIFKMRSRDALDKEIIGIEKSSPDPFL